jgi:hypothetical protein
MEVLQPEYLGLSQGVLAFSRFLHSESQNDHFSEPGTVCRTAYFSSFAPQVKYASAGLF